MGLELAKAYVAVRGDTSKVKSDLEGGKSAIASAAQGLAGVISGILATIGVGLSIGKIIGEMREGIALAEVQIDAEARVAAVVKGTGGVAGFTAGELKKMASAFQEATTVGDESILELMARMLTFKSITGDVFKYATEVALDTAAVMGTDARQAALMLGRALEDPVRGVSALRRTGVSFSEQQKVYIKQLVETNKLHEAQMFILDTVRGQMGEVAKAMAQTDAGKLKQVKNTLGDIKEELGKHVLPLQIKFIELQQKISTAILKTTAAASYFIKGNWEALKVMGKIIVVVGSLIGLYRLFGIAVKAAALAQSIFLALQGPKGWIQLAIGLTAASAAVLSVKNTFAEMAEASGAAAVQAKAETTNAMEAAGSITDESKAMEELAESTGSVVTQLQNLRDVSVEAHEKMVALMNTKGTLGEDLKKARDRVQQVFLIPQGGRRAAPWEDQRQSRRGWELDQLEEQIDKLKLSEIQIAALEEKFGSLEAAGSFIAKSLGNLDPRAGLELLKEKLLVLIEVGVLTSEQMAKIFAEAHNKSPMSKPIQELKKMKDEIYVLREGLSELDIAKRDFGRTPFVTEEQKEEFEKLKKDLIDLKELEGLKQKWETLLQTPLEKMQEGMKELERLREAGMSDEKFERGRKQLEEGFQGQSGLKVGAGAYGFAEYGRQMQDMFLKQKDPQKMIEENTKETAKNTKEMATALKEKGISTDGQFAQYAPEV